MAVTLYRFNSVTDAISTAVQAWMILSEFPNYQEKLSGYFWNAAGDLPVLQYKHLVFAKHNIVPFLRATFDLDQDLSQREKEESRVLQEICVAELEPAVQHALWTEESVSKEFSIAKGSFLENLLCSPGNKVLFTLEKNRIVEHLRKNHSLDSAEQALAKCRRAHRSFSVLLGEKNFFFSTADRQDHPRSADVVIYAYLKYQLQVLAGHAQITQSLDKFPNLKKFINRVEDALKLKLKAGLSAISFQFSNIPVEGYQEQEFFSPKVYESPLESTNQDLSAITYKCPGDLPPLRKAVEDNLQMRTYITSVALGLFFFLYLKT